MQIAMSTLFQQMGHSSGQYYLSVPAETPQVEGFSKSPLDVLSCCCEILDLVRIILSLLNPTIYRRGVIEEAAEAEETTTVDII